MRSIEYEDLIGQLSYVETQENACKANEKAMLVLLGMRAQIEALLKIMRE
jgi:hypothetical protein